MLELTVYWHAQVERPAVVVQSGTKDASPSKNAIPCIVPMVGIHQHVFLLKTRIQCRILILKYPFAHGKAVLTRIPHLTPLPSSSPFKNEYTPEQLFCCVFSKMSSYPVGRVKIRSIKFTWLPSVVIFLWPDFVCLGGVPLGPALSQILNWYSKRVQQKNCSKLCI